MISFPRRLLVVDDDEFIVALYCQALQGYLIASVDNGAEALDRIEVARPDLVILDLLMPVVDGWKVLERLRERSDSPPVLVISSSSDLGRAMEAGAAACPSKPFSVAQLRETCALLLRSADARS